MTAHFLIEQYPCLRSRRLPRAQVWMYRPSSRSSDRHGLNWFGPLLPYLLDDIMSLRYLPTSSSSMPLKDLWLGLSPLCVTQ
ncbi:hypothetical protein AWC14_07010 [Mycobacterium kyorinense]|uniref:Uncharacterized protein n=1 Tax=Mycobacterium kyorinense TaxID=487514 RepID=A0A1X1XUF9_9MYCO|nr:hypothetical protein AWC14_07010 [Mycobacterium kyorinense]